MMAKARTKVAKADPPSVTVTYDMFELPTAQHKAGLAGLLLQIESMKNRRKLAPMYRWDEQYPSTIVHVEFTAESVKSLFDDLYDAASIEGAPREKPFTNKRTKETIPPVRRASMVKRDKKGKEKRIEGYIYLELTPSLGTLRHYLPERGEWVRLWRDLIWQIIREGKKKAPYIARAAAKQQPPGLVLTAESATGSSEGEEDSESGKGDGSSWDDLLKVAASQLRNTFALGNLSGALLLGAMAKNAEALLLKGRVDHNLLLHFWPLAVMVFVPRFVDRDGESYIGRRDKRDQSPHFAVAVPEISDLPRFLTEFPAMLRGLSPELAVFRPRESLVDVPAEGAFSFLARLIPNRVEGSEVRYIVSAVDYFHVTKEGNNVKFLATGRVSVHPHLAEDYWDIVGRPGQKPRFGNPLFRRCLILALLEHLPWFRPFADLFAEWPVKFFIPSEKLPEKLPWFWADARKRFQEVIENMPTDPEQANPPDADDRLAVLIYRVVRKYLRKRLEKQSQTQFEREKPIPIQHAENLRKLAEKLFLEFRSRREQAFTEHFAGTFFAAEQHLKKADLAFLAAQLRCRLDEVKTLTLMSLSVNSWIPTKQKEAAQ